MNAQELFAPAGTSVSTSTVVFEYAIGDIIVGSTDNSNFQITQGFSQPRSSSATVWTGAVNSDWNNPGNWSAGIPNNTDDIVISGGGNNPVINTAGAACKNLTISSGGSITISDASYSINVDTLKIENGAQVTISSGDVYTNNVIHSGDLNISGGNLDIDGNYTASGNVNANISGGTIKVEGNWTSSGSGFDPTGGTVEFSGSVAQTISLAAGNNFYDLTINNSNATEKVSAQGSALVVSNHLNIIDGIFESASDYHDVTIASGSSLQLTGDITVSGNWTNNGTFTPGTHTVTFDGSTAQSIAGANNSFYNLTINNSSSGISLSSDVAITGTLNLTQGQIDINSISVDFRPGSNVSNASNNSHTFDGPLVRWFNSTNPFTYPCGDGTNYRPVTLTSSNSNSNNMYASYLFANQNQSSINSSLSSIETYGWDIQRSGGSDGFTITIPFDASYNISDFNNLTIAYYDGTQWTELPSTVTGTSASGSITTNSPVSDFSNRYFALGYKSPRTYVPDDNFEAYLETHDASGNVVSVGDANSMGDGIANNDYVTTANISSVINLDVQNQNIADLTGIEGFSSINNLNCAQNQLTSLDISQNLSLGVLSCNINQLTNLDVTLNTALNSLNCQDNSLTSLDLTNNVSLNTLYCNNNQLTTLDLSQNSSLINLNCQDNQISSLDFSQIAGLATLQCHSNQLTSLDITQNTALTSVTCYTNQISNLDLTQNINLTFLRCESNQLTSLDLTNNTSLNYFYCDNNQLSSLDLSNNNGLIRLSAATNQLTSLTVSNMPNLNELFCHYNQLLTLDVRNGNNTSMSIFKAHNNSDLNCISADDAAWATSNWTDIDAHTIFLDDCALFVALNADFSADATTVCQGFAVNFTDASTGSAGITSWSWDFGDGTTSTDQNPTHTYNTIGTYDVSLTVNSGADVETKTGYITVTQIGSIYADDFETQGSWTGDFGTTNGLWNISSGPTTSVSTGPSGAYSGNKYFYFETSSGGLNSGSIVSAAIDLTSLSASTLLTFWMHAWGDGIGTLNVGIGNSPSGTFTNVYTVSGQQTASETDPFQQVSIDVSAYNGQTVYIQLNYVRSSTGTSWNGDLAIDLLEIKSCVGCIAPTNILASNVTVNSADISWTAGGSETAWNFEYGLKDLLKAQEQF